MCIGYRLGKLTRETMTKEELAAKLGKNMKITTTSSGKLQKDGMIARTDGKCSYN